MYGNSPLDIVSLLLIMTEAGKTLNLEMICWLTNQFLNIFHIFTLMGNFLNSISLTKCDPLCENQPYSRGEKADFRREGHK